MEYLARLGELAGTARGFHVTLLLLLRCRGVEAPFFPFFSSRVRVGEWRRPSSPSPLGKRWGM
jgi:hypothetical protein